jgi:diguanylate cyclase (GGDEF)-like protein
MDITLDWLFSDERMLPAVAATLCAIAAAAGLKVYRDAFAPKSSDGPHWTVLVAVASAACVTGLLFADALQLATVMGLTQGAIIAIHIIRDLRHTVEEKGKLQQRQTGLIRDLTAELEFYKAATADAHQRALASQAAQARLADVATALDASAHAVALFSADERLVVCNRRFGEIHRLPADLTQPGTSYADILAQRQRNGEFAGQSAESIETWRRGELASRREVTTVTVREDGRSFETHMRLLADGRVVSTCADITELRVAMAKAAHAALVDPLTGLPNRKQFVQHLDEALARMKRNRSPLAVMMLDLDHFKGVNDALGLERGDKLLQIVAERLRELMRETDVIARISGDRFVLIADTLSQASDASILGQRLVDVLAVPYLIDGHQVAIGASVGISIAPLDAESAEDLLAHAETALRRAKGDGRTTFRFFETGMDTRVRQQRALEGDLRSGLARGEFEMFFQPIVSLARREIMGMEALLRWHHPERGLLLPEDFLPMAEEAGLSQPLARWAIREACACAASWPTTYRISVNVSARQLADAEFTSTVIGALRSAGLTPDRLELEVNERAVAEPDPRMLETLLACRDLGIRIALDDFGTGYDSLGNLQKFPFDRIKIEPALLKGGVERSESFAMLRAVAALAAGLRIETTVEGVETEEQLTRAKAHGCREAQGYFISPPLPAQDVDAFVARHRRVTAA